MLLPKAVGCWCILYLRVVIENVLFPFFFPLIVSNLRSLLFFHFKVFKLVAAEKTGR